MLRSLLTLAAANTTTIVSIDNVSTAAPNAKADVSAFRLRNSSTRLPHDVIRKIEEYLYYDWMKLLDVFLETTSGENWKFRTHVQRCKEAGGILPTNHPDWILSPIEANADGKIWKINLFSKKVPDSAIGDLLSLPSTLQILDLSWNKLTWLDVSILPRGLVRLYLSQNQLTYLDLTRLPPELEKLDVKGNKLTIANFTKLPNGLKWLYFSHNELREAQLDQLPLAMEFINLEMNYLQDAHFETLPLDRRETLRVFGQGNQEGDGLRLINKWFTGFDLSNTLNSGT